MLRDMDITLSSMEEGMEELEHSSCPGPEANGVLKALLSILAETYLTSEQQQRVEALMKRHSHYAYKQPREYKPL